MLAFGLTLEDLSYFLAFQISVFAQEKKIRSCFKTYMGTMFQGNFPQEALCQEGI